MSRRTRAFIFALRGIFAFRDATGFRLTVARVLVVSNFGRISGTGMGDGGGLGVSLGCVERRETGFEGERDPRARGREVLGGDLDGRAL